MLSWAERIRKLVSAVPARTAILLAGASLAVIAFVEVAENVVQGEAARFDHAVTRSLRSLDSPAADVVMRVVTAFGSAPVIIVVVLVAVWALRVHARAAAGVLVSVTMVAWGLNVALKEAFHRARPDLPPEITLPSSYSFPSGHTMSATAAYGMVAIVVMRLYPGLRQPAFVVATLLCFAVGTSRVFLGVHWPTDVLGGFAAGALLLVAGALGLGPVRRPGAREPASGTHE